MQNTQLPITLVILESPYKGKSDDPEIARLETIRNLEYARACAHDCAIRRESPYASHLLLTQPGVLDDNVPEERDLGIRLGFAWRAHAEKNVFYVDFGMSGGMEWGWKDAEAKGKPCEVRMLAPEIVAGIRERHEERLREVERRRKEAPQGIPGLG